MGILNREDFRMKAKRRKYKIPRQHIIIVSQWPKVLFWWQLIAGQWERAVERWWGIQARVFGICPAPYTRRVWWSLRSTIGWRVIDMEGINKVDNSLVSELSEALEDWVVDIGIKDFVVDSDGITLIYENEEDKVASLLNMSDMDFHKAAGEVFTRTMERYLTAVAI